MAVWFRIRGFGCQGRVRRLRSPLAFSLLRGSRLTSMCVSLCPVK